MGTDAGVPSLDFAQPAAQVVYTNGAVGVQIVTSVPPPTTVDVRVDGAARVQLSSPFAGALPTATLAEGQHTLDCHATFAGVEVACRPRTLIVDRTPPRIIGTTPFQYAYAAAAQPISATFSEPMAPGSVTTATLQVTADGAAVAGPPTLSSDGRTIAAGVTSHPAVATGIAVLKSTITDLAGNALGQDATWTWRWANAVSLGPSLPSQAGESAGYYPSIDVGPDSLPVVAYTAGGSNVEPPHLLVQRWDGSSWTKLASFPDQPSQLLLQISSSVAVDRGGRVLVAWTDQDMGVGTFETHVRVQNGATWDSWDDLPLGYRPHLVVDDAGDVALSMIALAPNQHPVVFRRAANGWQTLGNFGDAAYTPVSQTGGMAGAADGTLDIAWEKSGSSAIALSWTGSAWTPQSLPAAPIFGNIAYENLSVGMSRAGVAAFAWSEQTSVTVPALAAVFVPGWTDRRIVSGFSGVGLMDIDVDPLGLPLVTFSVARGLEVQRWSGSVWTAVLDQIHMNPTPDEYQFASLALDDSGKPFLVFEEKVGGNPLVYVVTTP
ncbi:MAG TPA: Ig-like domain-containing protein [Polyangia bacterium]|nr:Ig-like domain-containing protein [Polyangia bacterium]